ncbi:MAG: PilT/PilU family type 4a pilus ATPase [bacterium]|nr:PilT/PilU family type 4a pilus ATPase [bacterium]
MEISREVQSLLQVMLDLDASDIYITAGTEPMYRIDGDVRPVGGYRLTQEDTQRIAHSIMSENEWNEFIKVHEQNLALFDDSLGRFRINIMRQKGSVALVIRQIKTRIPTIEDLNLPDILKKVSLMKRGLVLMVGATGCGKSSTLASMVNYRNERECGHIITVEDPIEFVHEHNKSIITQREIGLDTNDYYSALKNALRQAPDVVVIGEIRDLETMDAAITFAETGHLCFATIHSNNANQAMERVMNFFPPIRHKQIYLQLSLNMAGIISQRLIKKTDGQGRVPAVEVLLASPRVRDLIYKGEIAELKSVMEVSTTLGMQTFDQSLLNLYSAGKISYDDAIKNADSANNLRLKIKLSEDGQEIGNISAKDETALLQIQEEDEIFQSSEKSMPSIRIR